MYAKLYEWGGNWIWSQKNQVGALLCVCNLGKLILLILSLLFFEMEITFSAEFSVTRIKCSGDYESDLW